jgi:hypothetical protein
VTASYSSGVGFVALRPIARPLEENRNRKSIHDRLFPLRLELLFLTGPHSFRDYSNCRLTRIAHREPHCCAAKFLKGRFLAASSHIGIVQVNLKQTGNKKGHTSIQD